MVGWIIAATIGGVILSAAGILLLFIAFRESTSCGWLFVLVPLYGLYYAISRWTDTKWPFLVSVIGVVLFVVGIAGAVTQTIFELEPVVAAFMQAGVARDVDGAYTYCSSGAITRGEIARFINYNYEWWFAGYRDVSTGSWSVETVAGTTTGYISGDIIYSDNRRLPFEASLVKDDGVWKITGFNIGP